MVSGTPAHGSWSPSSTPDRCEICGGAGRFERFQLREMLFGLRETFEYLRCPSCGALRIATIPADLGRHYPPGYYETLSLAPTARARGPLRAVAERARNGAALFGTGRLTARLLRPLARPLPVEVRRAVAFVRRAGLRSFSDAILDVGCGRVPGHLLALRALGFRSLAGIDPYVAEDSVVEGIPVRRRSIHQETGRYRLVTMHHSFEHMPDPAEALRSAAGLLGPGGILVIRMPVMGTWFWETFGTNWWELDPPRHLFVHTVASLQHCARPAGLELTDVVWDSTAKEIIASEQIARDIAWHEPASYGENPPAGFSAETVAAHQAKATELNASGRAGRAAFFFRVGTAHA